MTDRLGQGPESKPVCIVKTLGEPETLAFRTTTVTTFSDRRPRRRALETRRMNVSTLYDLWSGPVSVCTGEHCADAPQLLIVTSVPLRGRALSSVLYVASLDFTDVSVALSRPIDAYGIDW